MVLTLSTITKARHKKLGSRKKALVRSGTAPVCQRCAAADLLGLPSMGCAGGYRGRRARRRLPGRRGSLPQRRTHGNALYDAPLCGSAVPCRTEKRGTAGDPGLLGQHGWPWSRYLLGALQSEKPR